ncbi:MAG: hypothetical protein ACQKBV_02730 [Puniceicoccales bacterium]
MNRRIISILACGLALCVTGCATWPIAAARAAKKRESQTGPLMGELEQAADVEDPLGRKQTTVDDKYDQISDKVDNL